MSHSHDSHHSHHHHDHDHDDEHEHHHEKPEFPLLNAIGKATDNAFLTTDEGTYTYADLMQVAGWLEWHCAANDHVYVPSRLRADVILTIAASWICAIPCTVLPPQCSAEELQRLTQLGYAPVFIGTDADAPSALRMERIPFPKVIPGQALPIKYIEYALSGHKKAVFSQFLTSGTTGTAKLVHVNRGQVLHAAHASFHHVKPQPEEHWLLCLPLHHIGGYSIILRSLLAGSAVYLLPQFSATAFSELIEEGKLVYASLVPTQLYRILHETNAIGLAPLRAILLGGGFVDAALIIKARERFLPVTASFGMTETCAQIITVPIAEWDDAPPSSCGKPLPDVEYSIISDSGEPCSAMETGLLWLKSEQCITQYAEHVLHERFDKGWFCTGDFAHFDENGWIYIDMRREDLIVSGGENINPHEVEAVLKRVLDTDDMVVVGLPHPEWGQELVAVTTQSAVNWNNILPILKKELKSFQVPKRLITGLSLPRTASGKVIRQDVVALILADEK